MSLPRLSSSSSSLIESMALSKTTRFLARSSKTARFTVLVNWVDDPVDTGITTDCLVLRVDQDNFEVFVGRILVDPVRVQDTQVSTSSSDTLLRGRLQRSLILQLVDTLVCRFA